MNAPSDATRRSADSAWAAPDPGPDQGPGSGLAWLSRAAVRAAPPTAGAPPSGALGDPPDVLPGGTLGRSSHGSPGGSPGGSLGLPRDVAPGGFLEESRSGFHGGLSGGSLGDFPAGVSRGGTPGGLPGVFPGVAPGGSTGVSPGALGLPGSAGAWPTGQVVTWLPDGRWVAADAGGEEDIGRAEVGPDPGGPGDRARRRGERRVALARAGARLAGWPRRVLVGLLLVAAVLLAVRPHPAAVTATPAPPATDVVVAARDLAAGTVLAATDLRTVSMPVEVAPAGVSRQPAVLVGRLAAGAIRRGETVTDARVVGPGLAAGLGPGESAVVPVRLADADSAVLVRPGDRVDVLGTPVAPDGTPPAAGDAVDVATGVRVLAVLGGREAADGVVLVVGTTQQTARHLAGAAARHRLTVSVRSP